MAGRRAPDTPPGASAAYRPKRANTVARRRTGDGPRPQLCDLRAPWCGRHVEGPKPRPVSLTALPCAAPALMPSAPKRRAGRAKLAMRRAAAELPAPGVCRDGPPLMSSGTKLPRCGAGAPPRVQPAQSGSAPCSRKPAARRQGLGGSHAAAWLQILRPDQPQRLPEGPGGECGEWLEGRRGLLARCCCGSGTSPLYSLVNCASSCCRWRIWCSCSSRSQPCRCCCSS